ncbi:hypothetical protein F8388_012211 [Cannabis sativa]|uniref:Reverse transcriptase zinc-binding domain-containing protein n=1 Tax=Cannabis sativa TaxID=3483 RepID=A0A7J6EXL7_CANSA|nr:hypothetical protein F8388_012211 [Cannabis sativa]
MKIALSSKANAILNDFAQNCFTPLSEIKKPYDEWMGAVPKKLINFPNVLRQPMILIIGTMKLWDYSVKNAYKLLQLINGRCSSVTNFSLWRIWSLKIPAKVSVFLWRPCCNNLPTTVNLIGKHVDVPAVYSFFVRLKGKLWTMFLWIVHLLTYASLILIEYFPLRSLVMLVLFARPFGRRELRLCGITRTH